MKQLFLRYYHAFCNILIDLRFGKPLYRRKKVLALGNSDTVSTDYSIMPYLFNGRINQNDVFADIGCGQGRVLNWLLLNGFRNKIYGVEYESDIAKGLIKRLAKFNNVKILVGDALQLEFADATFFYMANPFDEELTRRFKNKLKNMASSDHPLTIIYYSILHLNVFTEDPD